MHQEPFVLLKNYRQQQDALKLIPKQKFIPIQNKLVKKTQKPKKYTIQKETNPQLSRIQTQSFLEPLIQLQQYTDDSINEIQYSPLLFNEFKLTYQASYCDNINLPDEAFGF
ncbi:unnamed protein product [Paramecium sonneborni]|uniref:Uncharacterized protein n=1 Tax=Paramecium sonneborni TaxID=65129 RepID=A0A8S1NH63_9CILI|nr:unnamed protein product [Paramecium sonneborni]